MKHKSYIKTIKILRKGILNANDMIRNIQDNKCKHPTVKKTHITDRSNWDVNGTSINRDWTRFYCPLCDRG